MSNYDNLSTSIHIVLSASIFVRSLVDTEHIYCSILIKSLLVEDKNTISLFVMLSILYLHTYIHTYMCTYLSYM